MCSVNKDRLGKSSSTPIDLVRFTTNNKAPITWSATMIMDSSCEYPKKANRSSKPLSSLTGVSIRLVALNCHGFYIPYIKMTIAAENRKLCSMITKRFVRFELKEPFSSQHLPDHLANLNLEQHHQNQPSLILNTHSLAG